MSRQTMNAMPVEETEFYWFQNATQNRIVISDLPQAATLMPGAVSRSFTREEVLKSSDLRKFAQLGLIVQVAEPAWAVTPKRGQAPLATAPQPPARHDRRVPEGIDVVSDGRGPAYVTSQGTDFRPNAQFLPNDYVVIKGPSGFKGELQRFEAKMNRWAVRLDDGRIVYVEPANLIPYEQAVAGGDRSHMEEAPRTLMAGDVIRRGVVPPHLQHRDAGTLQASDVIANRTATPASAIQGRAAAEEGVGVTGKRFKVAEVMKRGAPKAGVQIVTPDATIVDSSKVLADRTKRTVTEPLARSLPVNELPDDEEATGTIIVGAPKGGNPLEAHEVTPQRMVRDTVRSIGHQVERSSRKAVARAERRAARKAASNGASADDQQTLDPAIKGAPDHVARFFNSTGHQQKFGVSRMTDVNKLQDLYDWAPQDSSVKGLVEQRLQELAS
jgi:hypothetical protein